MSEITLSKTTRTYDYIKDGLKSGRWKFGDEISVVEISSELELSRRPVIDALKRLEAEFFIEIVPQTGCRVKKYNQSQMVDHFLTVMALEGMAAFLAAQRWEDHEVQELSNINEQLAAIVQNEQSMELYFIKNREIHYAILKMAQSEKLSKMTQSQWDLNDFFLCNITKFPENRTRSVAEHDSIIEKIAERDASGARLLMEAHVSTFVALIQKADLN